MKLDQSKGIGGLLKQGHTTQEGVDEAVSKNIEAAKQLGRIVHSSMGPNGMNKLVINHLEKTIVTSDCATIVRELEVAHPAARMITLAAELHVPRGEGPARREAARRDRHAGRVREAAGVRG